MDKSLKPGYFHRSALATADFWALGICLSAFALWSCLLTLKFILFGFYDWDLALYTQAMQSLLHGTTFASLFGASFLVDHPHYIAFLLTPLYFLFPHPLTLIHLELFSFFSGAFLFYRIAAKSIGRWTALVLMLIYLTHAANIFMFFYEFHFESLAIGLIFLMFYFYQERKWYPFLTTAMITMLAKENMALIVAGFGVLGLLTRGEGKWKWGGAVFLSGILFFMINMFVLVPFFRRNLPHASNIYWNCYEQFGRTPSAILQYLFFNPIAVIKFVCTSLNWEFLRQCLGPFLFLPLLGPRFWIALPILAQNFLSDTYNMHLINYHYAATIIPFAAMGAVDTLAFVKARLRKGTYFLFMAIVLYCSAIFFLNHWTDWKSRVLDWQPSLYKARQSMVEAVPKNASVIASFIFLSHLTDHRKLYAFYNVWKGANYFTRQQPLELPKVRYALIDFDDGWLLSDLKDSPEMTGSRVRDFFMRHNWEVKKKYDGIVLFERQDIKGTEEKLGQPGMLWQHELARAARQKGFLWKAF